MTDRYKLVRFYGTGEDYWELFDTQKDPHELKDVYNDPEYSTVKAQLTQEMMRLRKELKVPEEIPPLWFGRQGAGGGGAGKKQKQKKQQ